MTCEQNSLQTEASVPGCGGRRCSEEAETGELGTEEGLIGAVVDDTRLATSGGVDCVTEAIQQARLRDGNAYAAASLSVCSHTLAL